MEVGFAALALFALLAPGFGLVTGMRWASRYDIKTGRQSHTAEIIMLLLVASVLHTLLLYLYHSLLLIWTHGDFDLWAFLKSYKIAGEGDTVDLTVWFYLLAYVPFSSMASILFGLFFIWIIEKKIIPISMFHGSMYKIISGYKNPLIWCSILTDVKHEDCCLMYRGMVSEISYSSGYEIDYVSLDFVEKYLAKINPADMSVTTGGPKSRVTYTDTGSELFVINKSEIKNILFTKRLNLEDPHDLFVWLRKYHHTLIQGGILVSIYVYLISFYCVIRALG